MLYSIEYHKNSLTFSRYDPSTNILYAPVCVVNNHDTNFIASNGNPYLTYTEEVNDGLKVVFPQVIQGIEGNYGKISPEKREVSIKYYKNINTFSLAGILILICNIAIIVALCICLFKPIPNELKLFLIFPLCCMIGFIILTIFYIFSKTKKQQFTSIKI